MIQDLKPTQFLTLLEAEVFQSPSEIFLWQQHLNGDAKITEDEVFAVIDAIANIWIHLMVCKELEILIWLIFVQLDFPWWRAIN